MIYTVVIIVNNYCTGKCDEGEGHTLPIHQEEQPIAAAAPAPLLRMERLPGWIYMTCPDCSWENAYEDMTSAKIGIKAHARWCKKGHGRKAQLFG